MVERGSASVQLSVWQYKISTQWYSLWTLQSSPQASEYATLHAFGNYSGILTKCVGTGIHSSKLIWRRDTFFFSHSHNHYTEKWSNRSTISKVQQIQKASWTLPTCPHPWSPFADEGGKGWSIKGHSSIKGRSTRATAPITLHIPTRRCWASRWTTVRRTGRWLSICNPIRWRLFQGLATAL